MNVLKVVAGTTLLLLASTSRAAEPQNPTEREKLLLDRIAALEARLTTLEQKLNIAPAPPATTPAAPAATTATASAPPLPPAIEAPNAFLKDTTLNFYFDGYYDWNTNRPIGRANLLRAYDVTANNFSINQAGAVIERAPDVASGRRFGYRLDLQYGQATETLQGNPANEPRPAVWRNVFQAYGTYVIPAGKGLTVDFGKWASALGPEGNYTKDQINYSRSYLFNYLPFYHMGVRTNYTVNDRLTFAYWLTNGANQTEDFNNFKSQNFEIVAKPVPTLTWTTNYYVGKEQRQSPQGTSHILDTYAFYTPNPKLTLGAEFDYVISRELPTSAPAHVTAGAAYFRYQLTPRFYYGQRYERLNDRGGLFSGATQNLNEFTTTFGFRPAEGFEARAEYRRDFSNQRYFLTKTTGILSNHQDTVTLGLLWWFGGKTGGW